MFYLILFTLITSIGTGSPRVDIAITNIDEVFENVGISQQAPSTEEDLNQELINLQKYISYLIKLSQSSDTSEFTKTLKEQKKNFNVFSRNS